ncbi:MAG: hypothetical protein H0U38_04800 [Chloroflexia bacterium]|jgi:hypothetical protein|nr:hypothetical protein [Chloroflexia bacterium]MDQ3614838.1 hypothetical protein [Chloroflexota bacterium]
MFNPQDHLTIVDGSAYLEVKWRLVWLRENHPDARLETTLVESTRDHSIFRAEVQVPGGGSATGFGSEFREHFANYVEAAETKAIGRALAALGFGTQFAAELGTDQGEFGRSDASVPAQQLDNEPVSINSLAASSAADSTDRQRKLIAILKDQLSLSAEDLGEIATDHLGTNVTQLTRKDASSLITELQRRKNEQSAQRQEAS